MPTQKLAYSKIVADVDDENRVKLATVCCRFVSRGLVITLNFCSDFEHFVQDIEVKVQARFCS